MPREQDDSGTPQDVEIATTPHGKAAHIIVDGEPLCPRNLNAEYKPTDELPENGLCPNCKKRGQLTGLVEIPGRGR